jgi:RND family efflux transporter MFP subunit
MKRNLMVLGLAVVALAVLLLTTSGCEPPNQYVAPPPPEVTVALPVTESVADYLEVTGTSRASQKVDLRSRVSGYLQQIAFEDGAYVEQGQLLFVIEPEPFQVTLASENAKLRKAEAALALAEAEVKRTSPLVKRGAMAQQELDVKVADRTTAVAEVAAARAAVDQAEWNLRYTRITAPISGRIGRHMVDVGNLVQLQTTILTTLESIEPMHVYFNISENDVLRFMEDRHPTGANADATQPILVGLSDTSGYTIKGQLDYTELGVDPDTGTQQRRGVVPNKDHALLPGLFVRVRIPLSEPEPRLLVSERAIGADQRGSYVLVVNEKQVVERRPVELGIEHNGKRVIKKGVTAEDWLVVNGLQRARPGSTVKANRSNAVAASETPAAAPAGEVGERAPDKTQTAANQADVAKKAGG